MPPAIYYVGKNYDLPFIPKPSLPDHQAPGVTTGTLLLYGLVIISKLTLFRWGGYHLRPTSALDTGAYNF